MLAATVGIAALWPASYRSTGTILIEQQELPSDVVRSTVSSYAAQRIQIIGQRVMTTENLTRIIERYGLYADLRRRKTREEVVARMRQDTSVQMISADVIDPRDGRPTKATIAFSISYSNESPLLAAKVANELVSLYLKQNIETREQNTRDALTFLSGESERLSKDIAEAQEQLAKFKELHANELPDLRQLNMENKATTEAEIRETDSQEQLLRQQVVYLDAQLLQVNPVSQVYSSTGERIQSPADRLKVLRTEYAAAVALYAPDHPDVLRLKREIAGLEESTGSATAAAASRADYERQLTDARTQLLEARKSYSPDHPDVQRLQRLIDSLQAKVAALPDSVASPGDAEAADNPPYLQLRAQKKVTLDQIAALQAKRGQLQTKLEDYKHRLERTPVVESDYLTLLRDLQSAQGQYQQIRMKQMDAQVSQNLEVERKGERFTLIEPPFAPEKPVSPNRPLIAIFGCLLALGAGVGTVALLESVDDSVRGRQDLLRLLGTPPLAAVPRMQNSIDRARQRRRRRASLYAAAGAMIAVVPAIHFLYRPLDVLWSVALRHLGIGV